MKTMCRLPGFYACCVIASMLLVQPAAAYPWPPQSYSYSAQQQPISVVLQEFARQFGLRVELYQGLQGDLNGRLEAQDPGQFLDRLGALYGFQWYYQAGTLYVSPVTASLVRALSAPAALQPGLGDALMRMGVLETRFGWSELPGQGVVLVSGPPAYVRQVEQTLQAINNTAVSDQVEMIRLKHAHVQDRSISIRDQQVIIPGVASVLRGLLAGGELALSGAASAKDIVSAKGAAPDDKGETMLYPTGPVSVQADPRNNALIVKSPAKQLPHLRQLVAQLDKPAPLVEIEATIIDIDVQQGLELGIDWQAQKGGNGEASANLITTLLSGGQSRFMDRVRALEMQGNAKVISRPSVLTLDNSTAVLDISDSFFIRNRGERAVETQEVSVGLMIKVTPRVVEEDGRRGVQLLLDLEDGQINGQELVENLPQIRRSTISTQALVGENQSLLIAGHQSERQSQGQNGLPLLSRLPLIGLLFGSRDQGSRETKRLVLITPKIVGTGIPPEAAAVADVAGMTLSEVGQHNQHL